MHIRVKIFHLCICVCESMRVCVRVCIYVCVRVSAHAIVWGRVYNFVRECVPVQASVSVFECKCIRMRMHAFEWVFERACVLV